MQKELVVEIGFEELPALPLLKELKNIKPKFKKAQEECRLSFDFQFYYTPRRFIFTSSSFPETQEDELVELYGPPLVAAYKDGEPTKAALGFAKKCGVELDSLDRAEKNGKEVLYFKKTNKGKPLSEVLQDVLDKFIASLNFGRSMRWRDRSESFIRPIKWLFAMSGDKLLDLELFDIKSKNTTRGHMIHLDREVEVSNTNSFFETLSNLNVIYDQAKREKLIMEQMDEIEKSSGFSVDRDRELLDEVVAITEYPTALLGSIDSEFLRLPKEVIATSMKEHQRYFALYSGESIAPRFLVVSNALCEKYSKVVSGNERVLRARLSDALFFYDNDLKNGLNPEALKGVAFIKTLGSMYDKVEREGTIAQELFSSIEKRVVEELKCDSLDAEIKLKESIKLAKADLVSEMVYEFTELQGIMGSYYAKESGYESSIVTAIKEQYLPTGESSELPSTLLASIVALSGKLDTLFAFFSLGMIPSGNKDPYALRRAALGVLKIVREHSIPLKVSDFSGIREGYKELDVSLVEEFLKERVFALYDINPSVIKAVIASGEDDLLELMLKVEALDVVTKEDGFKDDFSTFKRVANISKDIDLNSLKQIDSSLFEKDEEEELFSAYEMAKHELSGGYEQRLKALFSLKPKIDSFFDGVMVNAEDEKIRENRKALIGSIYASFKAVADIKEISV
jgi:glycyl-tRNA synthetase beta chain